jgi:hypothetical protein
MILNLLGNTVYEELYDPEDVKLSVPPFARAVFHEFFHWLVYFKGISNSKILLLLMKYYTYYPRIKMI